MRGKQRELDIATALQRTGQLCIPKFEFVGQQERVRVLDRKGRPVIAGMIDGYIKSTSGTMWPTEIKSLSAYTTDKVKSFDDLYQGRYTWANAHQILAYLFSKNLRHGLFVMDRAGLPKLMKVDLEEHLEAMEGFLRDATVIVDHIEAGTVPNYYDDPDECRKCPAFATLCNPPISYDGAAIITSDEVLAQIEHHEAIKPQKSDYDQTHDDLADYLKRMTPKDCTGNNKKQIIAGKYLVTASWGKNTTMEFPDEATKRQFQKTDDTGKFSFKISRVVDLVHQ